MKTNMETNTTQNNKDAIDNILEKIESNELECHSKTYFRIKSILLVALVVAVFALSILLLSFIFFSIRLSGQHMSFGFGRQNLAFLLLIFSWKLFTIDLVLIVFLSWLLRIFRFGYKIPVLYLLLSLLGILVFVGFVFDRKTSFHDRMLDRADRDELPFFGQAYEDLRVSRI